MARVKQKIQPQSSIRLKQLCAELHITQRQLHDATGVSENTLSKIATGKGPLTSQIAAEIVKAFPSYRIEWLLGLDNNPHKFVELNMPEIVELQQSVATINLLHTFGVEIGQATDTGIFLPASKMGGFVYADKKVEIRRGDSLIWSGDMHSINNILLEICEFALFKINRLEGGGRC